MWGFGILILGGSEKISSSRVSGLAHRNMSPTWEYLLRDACAVGARMKIGIRNVRHVH